MDDQAELCVAKTGSGKGVSYSIPWLLEYNPGSMLVFDPKRERTEDEVKELVEGAARLRQEQVTGQEKQ